VQALFNPILIPHTFFVVAESLSVPEIYIAETCQVPHLFLVSSDSLLAQDLKIGGHRKKTVWPLWAITFSLGQGTDPSK
jgi:hypothetical protein